MKKTIIVVMLCCLFLKGISQVCGGGFYTFNVYTLNGSPKKRFYYELLPVSQKFLDTYDYNRYKVMGTMVIPHHHPKETFIKDTLDETLSEFLIDRKVSRKGEITPSLKFLTYELDYHPLVLKISDGQFEYYVLGSFFGGCKQNLQIIWKNEKGIDIVKLN